MATVKTLLALSNKNNWPVYQLDVCSAFLNGIIKDDIYITLPENFVVPKDKLCKLNKALYGLKSAPRSWYEHFNSFMLDQNFIKTKSDNCLYYYICNNCKVYLLIFVDDMLCTGFGPMVSEIIKIMKTTFKMKDLGLANHYLGINIEHDIEKGITTLNQTQYLKVVLEKFNMLQSHSVSTPMDPKFDMSKLQRDHSENTELEHRCRQLVGCIMYAMIGTRPDLCASITFLSRFQNCASNDLWICLKRILRYIKGTIDLKLVYSRDSNDMLLTGYADASWGDNLIDRKSTSGFCLQIYGSLVVWASKKQSTVALSSCEAEYVSLAQCISEACWLRNLLLELKIDCSTITIYEDNQSTIKACNSHEQLKRMKHLDIKYHFIKEKINKGIINVQYVHTSDQLADILTKSLPRQSFVKFRELMGLI